MIVAFSVTPLGVGEEVGEYVADAVRVVRESGLPNRTDAMFTSVEGEWDEVMDVVRRAVAAVEERARGSRWCSRPTSGRASRTDSPRRWRPSSAFSPSNGIPPPDSAFRTFYGR